MNTTIEKQKSITFNSSLLCFWVILDKYLINEAFSTRYKSGRNYKNLESLFHSCSQRGAGDIRPTNKAKSALPPLSRSGGIRPLIRDIYFVYILYRIKPLSFKGYIKSVSAISPQRMPQVFLKPQLKTIFTACHFLGRFCCELF